MGNKYINFLLSVLFDILASALSLLLSYEIVGQSINYNGYKFFAYAIIAWPVYVVFSFYIFKIYSILWRFSSITDLARIFVSSFTAIGMLFISQMAVFGKSFSFGFHLLYLLCTICICSIIRIISRKYFQYDAKKNSDSSKTDLYGNIMIIGAGSAASLLISEFINTNSINKKHIKCVIDDDITKKEKYISGIHIVGGRDKIIESVEKYNISMILFAIPSCKNHDKSEILNICQQTKCKLKIIPSFAQVINDQTLSKTIRNVEIEDLLGRDPIEFDDNDDLNYVSGKIILVTGGGGTIGSEICRQVAAHNPSKLIIFDVYENNAYDILNELKRNFSNIDVIALIGSVRDSKRLECIFSKYKPDIVYHAAAHKHVPLMEDSPNETIKNNVFGTLKTVQCADKYNVQKFVLISTDKAVNPTNIMGASKRICEMIIQYFNSRSDTEFVAVRFGNVLGSNGSVIPLFEKQIASGGPVTVTDPDIIRYFMTIQEAVLLVLQAGATAKGGEIFVLDMGKPVKILSLAENLIRLSGFTPYKDIKIEYVGLRPGEKLYEELLMDEEGLMDTKNKLIHIGKPINFDEGQFETTLSTLKNVMYDEKVDIRALVKQIVPTYSYNTYDNSKVNIGSNTK